MIKARSRVLVIDDDEVICAVLSEVLGKEGFEIALAGTVDEGMRQLQERRPDVVLLDVMLPGMDGFKCLEDLRQFLGSERLPIAMLTGADDGASIRRAYELGAMDFISKPVHWPTLAYRLRYLLRSMETLQQLVKSEATLRNAQKTARLGHWEWTLENDQLLCSDEALNVLALDDQIAYRTQGDLFRAVHPGDVEELRKSLLRCRQEGTSFTLDVRILQADDSEHVVHVQGAPVYDEVRGIVQVAGLVQDITEYRRIEDQVRILSHYDVLTGLANRTTFKEILAQGISYCDRYAAKLAALFVSIDRFKRINETFGPNVGDQILRQFTERLERAVRDSDFVAVSTEGQYNDATISRLGGNEFTILANHIKDSCDMVKIAKRILQGAEAPYLIDGHEIHLTLSIGICIYPGDGHDVDSFIQNGEFAMHHARELGQNQHEFYSKSLNIEAFKKLAMESSLRRAAERQEMVLYYQPKYDAISGEVTGLEALIRWRHPELGMLSPLEFIPLAEESDMILVIGEWVIEEACRQNQSWRAAGMKHLPISVNVSGVQFGRANFPDKVAEILARTGLPADSLELEMTESLLMEDADGAMKVLQQMKDMGIRISIDDFGTGYSSLSYLSRFPIDELKVDRSFVRNLPDNQVDATIAGTIIALAHALSLKVVAEGVEEQAQAEFLVAHGCRVMQGYLYSMPAPAGDIVDLVAAGLPGVLRVQQQTA
ncbi:MAG: EAL domain-containing protein [Sterolibacterium sp.]|nr:EAL domain-containing protein [Sterolibacterium sp.]MBP9799445.1 EAL domain-containing protein [Sterolibacterium sp.]